MKKHFTIELFGHTITSSVDIPEDEIEGMSDDQIESYVYEHINFEINSDMQLYIHDDSEV